MQAIEQIFDEMDTDGGGSIDHKEFAAGLRPSTVALNRQPLSYGAESARPFFGSAKSAADALEPKKRPPGLQRDTMTQTSTDTLPMAPVDTTTQTSTGTLPSFAPVDDTCCGLPLWLQNVLQCQWPASSDPKAVPLLGRGH